MTLQRLFAVLFVSLAPASAYAHIVITSPTPRVDADNVKEASAPCGGPRGDVVTQLTPGQMFTIEYDETVAHPGHFELNFSMAGDDFAMSIANEIPDQGGQGSYSYEFQVPNVECTDCAFQFVQVMTDRNPPTNYYSCIDVEIMPEGAGMPDAGSGEADMGGTGTPDMGTTVPADMGTTTPPATGNNNSGPGTDPTPGGNTTSNPAGETSYGTVEAHGNACSVSGLSPNDASLWLLALALFFIRRTRRD